MATQVTIYSDINEITPTKNALVKNEQAIFNSLYNILNTKKGERLFLPTFGCDIGEILFNPISDETGLLIYQKIVEAIETWETRVTLDYGHSAVDPDYDNNQYNVRLVFTINLLGDKSFAFEGSIQTI